MKRGAGLSHDPARAAEKRARREARRAAEPPRPEDIAREATGTPDDATDHRVWHARVKAGGCVMCAAYPMSAADVRERWSELAAIEAHHIVPKQDLKRWGLHARLWDPRNGIALCRLHHARHELAYQRVPRRLLPPAAWQFAAEIGAEFVLDDGNVYPRQET